MHLQESGEMYLETIYILLKKTNDVRSMDIAEYMNFSKPSVEPCGRLLSKKENISQLIKMALLRWTDSGKENCSLKFMSVIQC